MRDSLVVPSAFFMCLTALGVQSAWLVGNNIMYKKACLEIEKSCSPFREIFANPS